MHSTRPRKARRVISILLAVVTGSVLLTGCAADGGTAAPTEALATANATAVCPLDIALGPSDGDGDELDLATDELTLQFGEHLLGAPPRTKRFTVTNTLNVPVAITSLRYNAPYSVSGVPTTLQPRQTSAPFEVRFQPANLGPANMDLTFVTDQPPSTGINACRVRLEGVGITLPPRVSGPYDLSFSVTSTTIDNQGRGHSCTSDRHQTGTITLTLRDLGGSVSGTVAIVGATQEIGGTCSNGRALEHWNHSYSGTVSGTPDAIEFTIRSEFATNLSRGSDTLHFVGGLERGVISGTYAEVQSFTHIAGNGGGGGSASTEVTLR